MPQLRPQLRIRVQDIRLGMFIAELDRPWIDTAFPMQGMMLNDMAHLTLLHGSIGEVIIDPRRSTIDSLRHLSWDVLHLPADAPATTSAYLPVNAAPLQFSARPMGEGRPSLLMNFWRHLWNFSAKRRVKDRPRFLPPDIPLVVYRDQTTMAEEIARAASIVEQADLVLTKMVNAIRADLPVDIDAMQPVVDVLVDSVISNPAALMWSARMRDESEKTYLHGLKVAIYMMALGRHLGFPKPQLSELGSIGLLLDIGMLKMPPGLLEKTGQLTVDEATVMMTHVHHSIQGLEQNETLPHFVARGILEHHERIDGSGYPHGLSGDQISVYGRMAAIADTFAAMTTARSYDVTHSAFDAMKALFKASDKKLHAPLVEQFVQAISIFPVGSLIELASGEVAIVLEHNGVRRLEPKILILTCPAKNLLAQPVVLELMAPAEERKKILRGLADGAYGIDYRDYYLG